MAFEFVALPNSVGSESRELDPRKIAGARAFTAASSVDARVWV